jgi:hypothetical protein
MAIKFLFFLFLTFTFSFSQEKSITKFTKFEEGDTHIMESPIILENLAIKGDTIVGYKDYVDKKYYVSKDNGKNWSEQKISFKNESRFHLNNILWVENKLFLLGTNPHRGTYDNYIYSSNDFGKTWQIVNENLPFFPEELNYRDGKFFIRTLGGEGYFLNNPSGGLYSSNDCKKWTKISTDEIKNISDFYIEKDEVYVISASGLYKYAIKNDSWTNITTNLKSNFDGPRKGSKIKIVADKCYSIFGNKLEEYNLNTNELKDIHIPDEYQAKLENSIYSYNGILFLSNYNNLIYYKNETFSKINNESLKKCIQDVFNNSGGTGFEYLKFNKNNIILNGTLSFPFSALESNEDIKIIDSKEKLYRNNNLSAENIVNTKSNLSTDTNYYKKIEIKMDDKSYPYNFKLFKNIVSTNNSFYSLIYSPPGKIPNQQFPRIGKFNIKTNKKTLLSEEMFSNPNDNNSQNINAYNLNNDLDKLNTIYKFKLENYQRVYEEISIDKMSDNISTNSYSIPGEFEINSNGSIETFEVLNSTIGNGIIAFNAYSKFNSKVYLFLYDYNKSSTYNKIDLSKYINSFGSVKNCLVFSGILNGKNYNSSQCFIHEVIKNNNFTYVFFRIDWGNEQKLIPIRIDSNNKPTLMSQSIFIYGKNCRKLEYSSDYVCNDGLFYLPASKGFVNYYSAANYEGNEDYTIKIYDNKLNFSWQKQITGIVINNISDTENYIIIGGYTKTKGYLGYPNPRIIVINKSTKSICYDKVLAKKNGEIDYLSIDENGSAIIGVGAFCCKPMDTDTTFKPLIITDKLNNDGKFTNDLFEK